MKKEKLKEITICGLGIIVVTIIIFFVQRITGVKFLIYLEWFGLILLCFLVVITFFVSVIKTIIDGFSNVKNFKGNKMFMDIDKFHIYCEKSNGYYLEKMTYIKSVYGSKKFKQLIKNNEINDLIERKLFLERNIDSIKSPFVFVDAILCSGFTALFGLFINIVDNNTILSIVCFVMLTILEFFIMSYRYSNFINLYSNQQELYKYELYLIEKSIEKINNRKMNKKQLEMCMLKSAILDELKIRIREKRFFRRKDIGDEIDILANLAVCDNLNIKKKKIHILLNGKQYNLYYNNVADEIKEEFDDIAQTIINIVKRNNIGIIKKK